MSRTITHSAQKHDWETIESGVVYEDPSVSSSYKWYIGSIVYDYGGGEYPALVSLYTGTVYIYRTGKLPSSMRKATPGTITINVP